MQDMQESLVEKMRASRLDKSNRHEADDDFIHLDRNGNETITTATTKGEEDLETEQETMMPLASALRSPEGLSLAATGAWQAAALRDPKNRLALSALSGSDPRSVLSSRSAAIADPHVFNVGIPLEGAPITNQRASGRCWLFASTNVFRVALMRRYGLGEGHDAGFELSQAYLFFWDKLEKANFFLETVIETAAAAAGEDLDGRLVQTMLADPVSDGGQWDMVYNLVDKYGLVPQALYPDSWNAKNSRVLNYMVVAKLREYALVLRRMIEEQQQQQQQRKKEKCWSSSSPSSSSSASASSLLSKTKEKMVREIHLILTLTLGPPPCPTEPFVWDYVDSAGRARTLRDKTPLEFAKNLYSSPPSPSPSPNVSLLLGGGAPTTTTYSTISSMVSLVHDPRHPPLTLLTVSRLGNVVGGRAVTYVNVDMATLKAACEAMLRAGQPVFFGSDVGKFSDTASGIMDNRIVDYGLGFEGGGGGFETGIGRGLDKADRLRVGESSMTHAMVLTAVHVRGEDEEEEEEGGERSEDGEEGRKKSKYIRWRVQNSWGEDAGQKGWFVMTDDWMDEWVYQAVVDPRFLAQEVRDVLGQQPVVLPLWDPMGSLA